MKTGYLDCGTSVYVGTTRNLFGLNACAGTITEWIADPYVGHTAIA